MSRGLLLVNLGTPDAPTTGDVRRYLREFLSDPYVVDLHPVARWTLLNLVILPFRSSRSAEAYRKVWTERGSPLLAHGFDLTSQVARELEGEFHVHLAMRYGNPSIPGALSSLKAKGVRELTVLPLFPQFATSSTQSTVDRVAEAVRSGWPELAVSVVPPFYGSPAYLDAFAEVARPVLERARAEHVLFSFHGLPERHLQRLDRSGAHCLSTDGCCERLGEANRHCYRAQSFFTARALAERLGLSAAGYSVAFQSRMSSSWIRPFTDERLAQLARSGARRLAVVCPAFVADCLETIEEIGIRARELFVGAGGEELVLVPSLNAHPSWVKGVAALARAGGHPLEQLALGG